jgi:hypothetical protein
VARVLKQGLGVTAQDEIHVPRYARLPASSQLHRHAASGDEHDRSVIVYRASQRAGQHHRLRFRRRTGCPDSRSHSVISRCSRFTVFGRLGGVLMLVR